MTHHAMTGACSRGMELRRFHAQRNFIRQFVQGEKNLARRRGSGS
jgi:hypothetical protein